MLGFCLVAEKIEKMGKRGSFQFLMFHTVL